MKRSLVVGILLTAVIGGLIASTGYAFNLMTGYKEKYESQIKINDKLMKENKIIVDTSKKNAEEIDKQKVTISDLEKKINLNQEEVPQVTNAIVTQSNEDIPENISVDQHAKVQEQVSDEKIEQEPQYATYEGYPHAFRFAMDYGTTVEEILALNGLSSKSDLIVGNSYRIK